MKFRQQKNNMPPFIKAYAFSDLEILMLSHDTSGRDSYWTMQNGKNSFDLASTMAIQFSLQTSLPLLSFRYLGLNLGYTLE